ncbi:hypothetical protein Ddye_027732 [Dipteronia dyeriana]|uniref:Peptidase C14 caspase domain-containing protein n=1 Tax=Dipteronia dyeriana TaxID=168575 RepID=A0AAD9TPQ7_9ROSI|nr:hypothetical protein Ddye_027732 [Dipteronia dyeriana]
MEKGKQRRVVLVGCNYPNTKNELHGCINDVLAMKEVLIERFKFEPSGIELLTDALRPSGHGTRIPSMKLGHPLRQDEAIVPTDFNLITVRKDTGMVEFELVVGGGWWVVVGFVVAADEETNASVVGVGFWWISVWFSSVDQEHCTVKSRFGVTRLQSMEIYVSH